jgi:hypothetical protein
MVEIFLWPTERNSGRTIQSIQKVTEENILQTNEETL